MSTVQIENELYREIEAQRDYVLLAYAEPRRAQAFRWLEKSFQAEANAIGWASR